MHSSRTFTAFPAIDHNPSSDGTRKSLGWLNFRRVLCERWSHENLVLLGDAAATAHFSVGSGTKLALESAIALAGYLHSEPTLRGGVPALRTGAPDRGAAAAERGAQLDRVVRAHRALSPPRSGAVQLLAAHALAAHQPREPAGARQGVARERRDVVRGAGDEREAGARRGRRCSRRSACATCV